MTYYGYPDFKTGLVVESTVEGGAYEYLTVLAGRHYADLLRAEKSITDYVDKIELRSERVAQMVPVNKDIPPRFGSMEGDQEDMSACIPPASCWAMSSCTASAENCIPMWAHT